MADINTSHVLKIGQAQDMFKAFGGKTDERYLKNADAGALAKKSEVAKSDLAEALAKIIDDVVKESGDNKTAIATLNGTADGSVKKAIDDAFNDFATKVSDDKVVNTYKELIDYAAEHGEQYTALIGEVSALTSKLTLGKVSTEEDAAQYATVQAYVEAYVASQISSASLSEGNGISISDSKVSAKIDAANANGLAASADGLKINAATTSSAGAMSAADKSKLDGIEFATTEEVQTVIDGMFATAE
jgi:hypothetical protein